MAESALCIPLKDFPCRVVAESAFGPFPQAVQWAEARFTITEANRLQRAVKASPDHPVLVDKFLDSAIEINEPTRLLRVMHDGNDNSPKEFNRLFDDIKMAVVKRVKTARIQRRESG